ARRHQGVPAEDRDVLPERRLDLLHRRQGGTEGLERQRRRAPDRRGGPQGEGGGRVRLQVGERDGRAGRARRPQEGTGAEVNLPPRQPPGGGGTGEPEPSTPRPITRMATRTCLANSRARMPSTGPMVRNQPVTRMVMAVATSCQMRKWTRLS